MKFKTRCRLNAIIRNFKKKFEKFNSYWVTSILFVISWFSPIPEFLTREWRPPGFPWLKNLIKSRIMLNINIVILNRSNQALFKCLMIDSYQTSWFYHIRLELSGLLQPILSGCWPVWKMDLAKTPENSWPLGPSSTLVRQRFRIKIVDTKTSDPKTTDSKRNFKFFRFEILWKPTSVPTMCTDFALFI